MPYLVLFLQIGALLIINRRQRMSGTLPGIGGYCSCIHHALQKGFASEISKKTHFGPGHLPRTVTKGVYSRCWMVVFTRGCGHGDL
ncbi:hypothetical protein L228DRAFT_23064 [Xylona heveae TC161]|uniref:Uncharacterized protein n=1 Tax=Xylona heveae (strain CBS 132557 / TC161) TaxID=1328760 RepID=A0A165K4P6_XYLHT|nr:hypothetical protein L228DRAFT_23064 [Xylona heveae TC161]KZF26978.1 hypothetical protein L228DRAFT_23064 [Xylona heveae TC161]